MYTSHGHQIPGTPIEGDKPVVYRCGGIKVCRQCKVEASFYRSFVQEDESGIDFKMFVRKPFTVEAVRVTNENMEDLARMIGRVITDNLNRKVIEVDPEIVPNIPLVWPGYWVTRMGENIRCYSAKTFAEQFVKATEESLELVLLIEKQAKGNNQNAPESANS